MNTESSNKNKEQQRGPARTIIRPGLSLPAVSQPSIATSRKGLCVVLPDTSGSMLENNKLADANSASRALLTALADPSNRGAFYFGLIAYGDRAEEKVVPKPAAEVVPAEIDLAVGALGSQTNIGSALTLANQALDRASRIPGMALQPVIVLMTDGQNNCGPDPIAAAATLKSKATVVAAAFGDDADMELLRKLATSPNHAVRCSDGASLRSYFATVGATISSAAASGRSVAALLGGKTYAGFPGKK